MFKFANNAASTLAVTAALTDGTLTVATGEGALFPTLVSGESFIATIQQGALYELVECTGRSGDVLTVTRAQDGTTAQTWTAGASVSIRIPAGVLHEFVQREEIDTLDGKADRAGDTFTGDTGVTKASPIFAVRKTASGQKALIRGGLNALTRWDINLGNATAESGSAAGSDFAIERYNNAGVLIGAALTIDRATGLTSVISPTTGDNTTKVATTAFVLAQILASFTGSNRSVGVSGYQKLPGGFILQWANLAIASGGSLWTFPTAFPTACIHVSGSPAGVLGATFSAALWVVDYNATGAALDYYGSDSANALVLALGY